MRTLVIEFWNQMFQWFKGKKAVEISVGQICKFCTFTFNEF